MLRCTISLAVYEFPFHLANITNLLYFVNMQTRKQPREEPGIFDFTRDLEIVLELDRQGCLSVHKLPFG